MKLLVGLGNIGDRYRRTRHNIGFQVLDTYQRLFELPPFTRHSRANADVTEAQVGGDRIILAKPTTMMNLSGQAVADLASFYKIPVDDIWVIHDDFELPFGTLRIRRGGGSSHNGVRSLVETVGEGFARIRIGVFGNQLRNPLPPEAFVLQEFTTEEWRQAVKIQSDAAMIINNQLAGGLAEQTMRLNSAEFFGDQTESLEI
jgi:peptidyl-tRNA hydrolase, PTH1 family